MAIAENALIDFLATADEVTTTSSAVANDAFSVAGDTSEWTNDDDSPLAIAVLGSAFGAALAGGTTVDLYARKMNIQSTNDSPIPIAGYKGAYLGSFLMDDIATKHYVGIEIYLENYQASSVYEFYVNNQSGQQMSATWNLYITPKTRGPHPA